MDKRELLLRKRIARLESLVRASKSSTKNEGINSYEICREILDEFGNPDWIGESDIEEYLDDNYPELDDKERWYVLDRMEKFVNVDPYSSLNDEDDDMDEACSHRKTARRKMKRESNRSIKREAVFTLPNGMPATTVADVLSGWADTDYHRPGDAIRELRRVGVLKNAVNRWYPTEDDVADAVEYCWNDPINSSVAKLFASDFGDYTQMALSLMPAASSSGSRTQDVTLRFTWDH